MNCKNCGFPLTEENQTCPSCGAPNNVVVEQPVEENVKEVNETISEPVTTEEPTPAVEQPVVNANQEVNQPVERKRSKAPLIIGIIFGSLTLVGLLIFLLIIFVLPKIIYSNNPKTEPIVEPKSEETVVIDDYTFTVPEGFKITKDSYNQKMLGNDNFSVGIDFSSIKQMTYEYVYSSKDYMASLGNVPEGFIYKGYFEESYSGEKYLIFRYENSSRNKDIYDKAIVKFDDKSVFMTQINYAKSERYNGYSLLSKFIESGKSKETATTTTTEDYMVVGNDTLGYLKLPGKWTKGSVAGAPKTAIQYVNDATVANTAKGSYIVTLNVWKEKPDATTAKYAAEQEANYYNTNDPDASNVSVELVKLGKLNAYKLSCQYKSDNVWVITWYIDGDDGLVHIIQVEGLDRANDYFKIPETFSFTEIK